MATTSNDTRERIISAASKLFYSEGIRAVSVDAVAEKAGLTKRTLYYHFRSKDDLVAAYLYGRDQPNLALFQRWFHETEGGLAEKVRGIFIHLAASARHPPRRVKHRRARPRHALHHHQPQRFARHVDAVAKRIGPEQRCPRVVAKDVDQSPRIDRIDMLGQ